MTDGASVFSSSISAVRFILSPPPEAALGVLAQREKLDDVRGLGGRQRRAQQREGVDGPVAQPAARGLHSFPF